MNRIRLTLLAAAIASLSCVAVADNGAFSNQGGKLTTFQQSTSIDITSGSSNFGAGSTFKIVENGATVFSGTFTSLAWQDVGNTSTRQYEWSIPGSVSGMHIVNGHQMTVTGGTVQLTTVTRTGNSFTNRVAGDTIKLIGENKGLPGVIPESGTLTLFGTGLVAVALLFSRRRSSGMRPLAKS